MGLFRAGLGLLFSTGLPFNAWYGKVAELPSVQHWLHPPCMLAAVPGLAWEKPRRVLRLDKLKTAVCLQLALCGVSNVALGACLALPFHTASVRPGPPLRQACTQQVDESSGAVGTGSAHPILTPSFPFGLSLAQRFPLFILGGKGVEHNLDHL